MIPSVLDLAKLMLEPSGLRGGVVLDGTVGNGHDTLFLATLVGESGHVFGFDIQEAAIAATRARLVEAGVSHRVTLIQANHAAIAEHLPPDCRLRAAMYNLGYLPGGNKGVITRTASTLPALDATLERLEAGAMMTVVLYSGHAGGEEEARAVLDWARALPRERADAARFLPWNTGDTSPSLLIVAKR